MIHIQVTGERQRNKLENTQHIAPGLKNQEWMEFPQKTGQIVEPRNLENINTWGQEHTAKITKVDGHGS